MTGGACHVGVDMGATLAKLAFEISGSDGRAPETRFELMSAAAVTAVAERVIGLAPTCVGLTGGGASELAKRLPMDTAQVNEFAAWGAGASQLLGAGGVEPGERYLLVSIGTGTSALLVDGMSATRIGGTALGGGALLGLGAAMLGTRDFEEVCALAAKGARASVDLLVSDIYRSGEISLMADITAASFGKLALAEGVETSREDLAAAITGLVGENVALICTGLAAAAQVSRIVFAGATLRGNDTLRTILTTVSAQLGRRATVLEGGEFAGALGGLVLARAR